MKSMMAVSGAVAILTCASFFIFEYYSFRDRALKSINAYGDIIALNSTAALAFQSPEDAQEILSALKVQPNIVAAAIYDSDGKLFCQYPEQIQRAALPQKVSENGYNFTDTALEGFQPITKNAKVLGTLYIKSDLNAMYNRLWFYTAIAVIILSLSFLLAFLISRRLQNIIAKPILTLAETATAVSQRSDYSVRATKTGNDELGLLTDAFNHMLGEIQLQTKNMNELNLNLERRVRERTTELEEANKEMESFSYSVSHDLRAPVNAMNRYITMFMGTYAQQQDENGNRLLALVSKNIDKMNVLIDGILSFTQVERIDIVKETVSMNSIVDDLWHDLYKPDENRTVVFKLHDLPDACAERHTIEQVWTNLISNALKYTRNTPETIIEIAASTTDEGILYSIKDNGSGFDMKYYDKVFGVFQRLHSQDEFEGTGVGLAIVEKIINKHGGRIWAESKVSEGATFYFLLPEAENNRVMRQA